MIEYEHKVIGSSDELATYELSENCKRFKLG